MYIASLNVSFYVTLQTFNYCMYSSDNFLMQFQFLCRIAPEMVESLQKELIITVLENKGISSFNS
jgi:hypothetical protein